MSDRREVSGNLPAEFAERASDPVDAWAWQRARQRYELPRRNAMPEITHVLIDYSRHFLVVDGTRGPVELFAENAATHPAGYIRYRSDAPPRIPAAMRGKTFTVVAIVAEEVKGPATDYSPQIEALYNAREAEREAYLAKWPEAKP